MNFRLLVLGIGIIEGFRLLLLQQVGAIPPGVWDVASDFPLLVGLLLIGKFMIAWTDKLLEQQQKNLKEVYGANQAFVNQLILKLEDRQNILEDYSCKNTELMVGLTQRIDDRLDQRSERRGL